MSMNGFDSGSEPQYGTGERVQAPGTVYPALKARTDTKTLRQRLTDGLQIKQQAGDKYGVRTVAVGNDKTYQLLPADPDRKVAFIKVPGAIAGVAVVIGPEGLVDGLNGYPMAQGDVPHQITAKGAVYAKATSATVCPVCVWVERYEDSQLVN